VAVES